MVVELEAGLNADRDPTRSFSVCWRTHSSSAEFFSQTGLLSASCPRLGLVPWEGCCIRTSSSPGLFGRRCAQLTSWLLLVFRDIGQEFPLPVEHTFKAATDFAHLGAGESEVAKEEDVQRVGHHSAIYVPHGLGQAAEANVPTAQLEWTVPLVWRGSWCRALLGGLVCKI